MTTQSSRDLLKDQPFQSFRLVMSSGSAYEVRHPEMAWVTKTSVLVGIDEADDGLPVNWKVCSLLHVTPIDPLNSPAVSAKKSNLSN